MIYAGRAAVLCAIALTVGAGAAYAGGDVYDGEPVPAGPADAFAGPPDGPSAGYGDKGFAAPGGSSGPPDDATEAYSEAQYVDGDPYGRTDYWQDGRGNRRGTVFGPGFYQKGYYHPGERQFPDYWAYDRRRQGPGSLWRVAYRGVIDPFVPDQYEIDWVRALPARIITKTRIDEDLRRLHRLAKEAQNDSWAGGRYDSPRPLK